MCDDFFEQAHDLARQGIPFATATVVRAERPTSGKLGDQAIITADGQMHGWIGGSCAQPTVVREALAALREDQGRLVRLSPDPAAQAPREGMRDVPMTCYSGGTLEIFVQPHPPRPRLLVVGGLPAARALAHLGRALSYHVIVADPDHAGGEVAGAAELLTDLDAMAGRVTPFTFAVVATHGVFCALYTDRASHFIHTPPAGHPRAQTQVERALQQLGIELIWAHSPQARGRKERLYGTLQGRWPQELRLRGVTTAAEANAWLQADGIAAFNRRFAVAPAQPGSAFL
ncbi:MAG: hypothetical protein HGA45_16465, partial [Chloroflexales bacterium]|nr:hypothetical protein [Chloroflexales bacterium]